MAEHDRSMFGRFAKWASRHIGHPVAFLLALALVVGWAISGPFFGFSETWQLFINSATTIATFLIVFLIQNTQTRDSVAMQVKLDELIHAMKGANDEVLDIEELSEDRLEALRQKYEEMARRAREEAKTR